MILCDTNILVDFYKNVPEVIRELHHIGQNQLAISTITQTELHFGAINKVELKKIKQHLALLNILPLEIEISQKFIQLMEIYALSHKLSIPDALIASTALVHQIELYTLNVKNFQFISGLDLYNLIT